MSSTPSRGRPRSGGPNRYYCSHGLCNNNTKDIKDNVRMLPFPKPCPGFILTLVDSSKDPHNISKCEQCSKCARWIHLCRRADNRLKTLVDINNSTYICTEHFHNGLGPTDTNLDPLPATKCLREQNAIRKSRSEPKDRSGIPLPPPRKRKRRSPMTATIEDSIISPKRPALDSQDRMMNDEIPTANKTLYYSENVTAVRHLSDHDTYSKKSTCDEGLGLPATTQSVLKDHSRPTLMELALLFLKNNLNVTFHNDLIEIRLIKQHVVEKTCTIDSELNLNILVFNRQISSDHDIWKKYSRQWVAGFDYIAFLKDLFESWYVCDSCMDTKVVSQFQATANTKNSYRCMFRYDPVTNSLRSVQCCLLVSSSEVCYHCKKITKNLRIQQMRRRKPTVKGIYKHRISHLTREEAQRKLRESHYKLTLEKRKNARLRKKMQSSIKKGVKLSTHDSADFLDILQKDKSVTSDLAKIFFEEQIKAAQVNSKYGHRWHPLIIKWCLYLKAKSASTYTALRKVITLPSEKRLYQLQSLTHVKPGFNVEVLDTIETEFQNSGTESHRRYCSLLFDEVKIQEDLVYKSSTGEIIGFVQLSDVDQLLQEIKDEVNGIRKTDETLATHILQLMIKGISSSVETTYAYFPTKTLKAHNLFTIVWEAIEHLEGRDIRVLALVSDGAAVNRAMYKMSSEAKEANWCTRNPYAPERYIYFVCDVPHLLKTTRNAVSNSGSHKNSRLLRKNNRTIEWYHFVRAYKQDLSSSFRILHHITNDHLYLTPTSLMKVKLAVQVLSQKMATAIKKYGGDEVSETVIFIEMFNKFFDVMNTRHLKEGMLKRNANLNAYTSPDDERLVWLNDTFLAYLEEWKQDVLSVPGNFSAQERKKMIISKETMDGLQITVKSVTAIIKFMLAEGAPFILTNKLNQDPLEMEFSKQRGASGANTNPNVVRYGDNVGKLKCLKENAYFGKGNITH